jgi:hypothetical protein
LIDLSVEIGGGLTLSGRLAAGPGFAARPRPVAPVASNAATIKEEGMESWHFMAEPSLKNEFSSCYSGTMFSS